MKDLSLNADAEFHSSDIHEQHQELADAMTELRRTTDHGSDAEIAKALDEFVEFLSSYFLFHTFTEEKLMYDHHYPRDAYFAHVREHKEVILDLIEMQDGHPPRRLLKITATNPRERAHQLIEAFTGWIHSHIEQEDSKLLAFLEERGI